MVRWCKSSFVATLWFIVICISIANVSADNLDDEAGIEQLLPGLFPSLREIPKTGFSCLGRQKWHYYADVETGCQVFHVCETQHSKISFLCPIGSIFSQRHLVCVWWYNVECQDSSVLYPENNSIEQQPEFSEGSDLRLAASGGNKDPSTEGNLEDKTVDVKKAGNLPRRRS